MRGMGDVVFKQRGKGIELKAGEGIDQYGDFRIALQNQVRREQEKVNITIDITPTLGNNEVGDMVQ